jgi:hypothetical protein
MLLIFIIRAQYRSRTPCGCAGTAYAVFFMSSDRRAQPRLSKKKLQLQRAPLLQEVGDVGL